ncbi:MAG: MarR family transcriptional regulator [Planctomycetota bacterium]
MPSVSTPPSPSHELRSVDRELLKALRGGEWMDVSDLKLALGVTATAVRQRIDRLMDLGLIDREKSPGGGRGRPTFCYRLSVAGHHHCGANPIELADAMWAAILGCQDAEVRETLIGEVAKRLGQRYALQLEQQSDNSENSDEPSSNLFGLAALLKQKDFDLRVSGTSDLPVLDIGSCPYPTLADASDDREMCRLEEQMLSEALGQPVKLSSCQLDGHECCQFRTSEQEVAPETSASLPAGDRPARAT